MSAYSEYKCGAIDYDEFKSNMRREYMDYDPYDRFTCRDCASYKDCYEQIYKEGYPQCEEGMNHEEWFEDAYEEFDNKTTCKKCIECRHFGYAVDSQTGEVDTICWKGGQQMTDELKQWEYDKGYEKGKKDGAIEELEQIKTEIYDITNWVKPQMIKNDMVKLIDKHISELKGVDR